MIVTCKPHPGLFSALFGVLDALREAELSGEDATPVWGPESPYWEGGNAWLDLFEPPTHAPEARGRRVERCGWDGVRAYPNSDLEDTLRTLVRRYVRVVPEIQEAVDRWAAQLRVDATTAGVHLRGTDKAAMGAAEFAAPPVDAIAAHVRATVPAKRVLVATDDARLLREFRAALPDFDVLCTDATRSATAKSLHDHYGRQRGDTPLRDGGRARAREALVDAMLLARCGHLVRSPSGVSLFALLLNPVQTFVDVGRMERGYDWEAFLYGKARDKTPMPLHAPALALDAPVGPLGAWGVALHHTPSVAASAGLALLTDGASLSDAQRRKATAFCDAALPPGVLAHVSHDVCCVAGRVDDACIALASELAIAHGVDADRHAVAVSIGLFARDAHARLVCTASLWKQVEPMLRALEPRAADLAPQAASDVAVALIATCTRRIDFLPPA